MIKLYMLSSMVKITTTNGLNQPSAKNWSVVNYRRHESKQTLLCKMQKSQFHKNYCDIISIC